MSHGLVMRWGNGVLQQESPDEGMMPKILDPNEDPEWTNRRLRHKKNSENGKMLFLTSDRSKLGLAPR